LGAKRQTHVEIAVQTNAIPAQAAILRSLQEVILFRNVPTSRRPALAREGKPTLMNKGSIR
jgi:hypothetical protein